MSSRVSPAPSPGCSSSSPDAGSVTAEFALVMPAVLLVLGLSVGCLATASSQVRLMDASADAARALARGETSASAATIANRISPGASLTTSRNDGVVCVELAKPVRIPMFDGPAFIITAEGCALEGGL